MRTLRLSLLLLALPALAQERLTLDEAVRRALIRNTSAVIAQQEILRAEGILFEQRGPALPQITGNATDTRIDSTRTLAGRVITPIVTLNANIALTVPLISPRSWVQWAHAKDQVEIAQVSNDDVRRTVAIATARAYIGVMAARRLVGISQQSLDNAKAHFEDAHARFEVGSGNRLDEARAGQQVSSLQTTLSTSYSALARAQEALGVLVGDEGPVDVLDQIALPNPPAPDEALRDAQEKRPDIRAQKLRLEAADHVVRDSVADYLPFLEAIVQPYYQQSTPTLQTVPVTGWQAQLVLTLPIFDGGARYGLRRERSANRAEAEAQLDGLLRQARSDVRVGFEEVRRADDGLASARQASKLAHDALEMTMLAYREGATNDLEVVDAQRAALDTDLQVLVNEDNARQARIDLLSASGRFP